ncbi:hypothetical protein BKA63DRAFT_486945 [Paraphoma chrysanthemicola]|nr:hypothetical protein BKA63DRAFT_486945 [Paraphoma chrysanthemicola]
MAAPIVSLLDMPNELLVNIVQHVDAGGIKSLSLVCQHIRSIAQGFLFQTAILSPSKIWKLVDTLVFRPEFAKRFTELRLGPMSQETHEEMKRYGKERNAALTVVNKNAYRRILRKAYGAGGHSRILRIANLFKDNPTSIGLALLFALAPKLRLISMGTGSLETIPLLANVFKDRDMDMYSPELPELHRLFQPHFQECIENLTIFHEEVIIKYKAGRFSKSPTQYYERLALHVKPFHNLKHLAVPFWLIAPGSGMRSRHTGFFCPHQTLPESLVSLHIVHDSRWQVLEVGLIDILITNTRYFCNLTIVKLVFHGSFWQTASLFASNPRLAPDLVPALDRWRRPASGPDVLARAIERCRGESMTELFNDPAISAEFGILRPPHFPLAPLVPLSVQWPILKTSRMSYCSMLRSDPMCVEALFRTAKVPLLDLWKLASALLRRPDLAKLFTCLDIVGLRKEVCESLQAGRAHFSQIVSSRGWSACYERVRATYSGANDLRTVAEMKTLEGFIFAAFAMIVAHTPALKILKMTTGTLEYIQFGCVLGTAMDSPMSTPEYHGKVRFLLQSRLDAIEIIGDTSHLNHRGKSVTCPPSLQSVYFEVGGYIWLNRLVVPHQLFTKNMSNSIQRKYPRLPFLLTGLPASLRYLRVEWTDNPPLLHLTELDRILTSSSRLRQLELRFRTNLYSTAWDACQIPIKASVSRDILERWNGRSDFTLTTTFGCGKHTDVAQRIQREAPAIYESGDLESAIARCLATTTDQLALQADLMDALGYTLS